MISRSTHKICSASLAHSQIANMHTPSSFHRLTAAVIAGALGLYASPALAVAEPATNAVAYVFLRPHCSDDTLDPLAPAPSLADFLSKGMGSCKNYPVRDPVSQQTPSLAVGDTLDMDVIIFNPNGATIKNGKFWLSYDPQALDGVSIEMGKNFPTETPGEADFSPADGLVKLTATAETGHEPNAKVIDVARVQFTVAKLTRGGLTPIGFYDPQPDTVGHTYAVAALGTEDKNILSQDIGSLIVLLSKTSSSTVTSSSAKSASTQSTSSVSSTATTTSSSVSSAEAMSSMSSESTSSLMPAAPTNFVLLQVQNFRAGTDGGTIALAWDRLNSSETAGYNIYYGTQKGRYIQRESVTPDSVSDVIRGLPENTVYYLAIRAFNTQNEESAFSQEVMIRTGDPTSSTAPLILGTGGQGPGVNPLPGDLTGNVPGQSGVPNIGVILLGLAAVVGTAFAFKRQMRTTRV